MEKIKLTVEGKKELEQRLNELRNDLIPAVVQRIKTAREQGDLSENAEYHSAKDEQGKLEGEANEIENKLKNAEIIVMDNSGAVQLGTKLRYLDIDEDEIYEVLIVGSAEADFTKNKMSIESPVGQALKGKKEGDVVTIKAPRGGDYQVKILEILD